MRKLRDDTNLGGIAGRCFAPPPFFKF